MRQNSLRIKKTIIILGFISMIYPIILSILDFQYNQYIVSIIPEIIFTIFGKLLPIILFIYGIYNLSEGDKSSFDILINAGLVFAINSKLIDNRPFYLVKYYGMHKLDAFIKYGGSIIIFILIHLAIRYMVKNPIGIQRHD